MSKVVSKNKENADSKNTKKVRLNKNQTINLYQNKEKELQNISEKLKEIDGAYMEVLKAETTLKALNDKETILVNLGAGIFGNAKMTEHKTVKVMLPGSVMIDKSVEDVFKDLEERKKNLQNAKQQLMQSYNNTLMTLKNISSALQQMMQMENSRAGNTGNVGSVPNVN